MNEIYMNDIAHTFITYMSFIYFIIITDYKININTKWLQLNKLSLIEKKNNHRLSVSKSVWKSGKLHSSGDEDF